MPPVDKLLAICRVLDCTIEDLLHQEGTVCTIVGEPDTFVHDEICCAGWTAVQSLIFMYLSAMSSTDEN